MWQARYLKTPSASSDSHHKMSDISLANFSKICLISDLLIKNYNKSNDTATRFSTTTQPQSPTPIAITALQVMHWVSGYLLMLKARFGKTIWMSHTVITVSRFEVANVRRKINWSGSTSRRLDRSPSLASLESSHVVVLRLMVESDQGATSLEFYDFHFWSHH